MVEAPVITKEQVNEIAATVTKLQQESMEKHITELLPEALKKHGLQSGARRGHPGRLLGDPAEAEGADIVEPIPAWSPTYKGQLLARANVRGEWTRFAEYLKAIFHKNSFKDQFDARLKANNENDPAAGGFMVPDQFVAQLLMLALEAAVVRPRAFIMPMTGQTMKIPAIQDTSHATTVFGGVQGYWVAESGAFTESNPSFRQVVLTARKLLGYTTTSNELMVDSAISAEALLIRLFSDALAYFEDEAFINGTGAGQPLGILNAPALISVAKETGQAATTIVAANLDKMWSRMLSPSKARAVWLANSDTFPQLAALPGPPSPQASPSNPRSSSSSIPLTFHDSSPCWSQYFDPFHH